MAKAKTTPRALVVRRTAEGTRLSQIPDDHVFSARWVARELASGLVEVELRIKPDDGPVQKYTLTGFEPILEISQFPFGDGDDDLFLRLELAVHGRLRHAHRVGDHL